MSTDVRPPTHAAPAIRPVVTHEDFLAVAMLRYAVYAEEESLNVQGVDHHAHTLTDADDAASYIVAAFDGDTAVATLRITPLTAFSADDKILALHPHAIVPVPMAEQCSIGRLMVLKFHRGSSLCAQMFAACYRAAIDLGYEVGFIETNPRTLPLYEFIGCRCTGSPYGDETYGLLIPMAFLFRDLEYLQQIRSPLCALTPDVTHHAALGGDWFNGHFGAKARPRSVARLDSAERTRLASLAREECCALNGLTDREMSRLLRSSAILDIDAGTCVLPRDSRATEAYVILDGCIRIDASSDCTGRAGNAVGGSILAECNLQGRMGQPVTHPATAVTPTRLLSLSAESFAKIKAVRRSARPERENLRATESSIGPMARTRACPGIPEGVA